MTAQFIPGDLQRFESALRRFDEENAQDPNRVLVDGKPQPRELVYARWLTDTVLSLCPSASEELRLAARCQHLCRWLIPRTDYPQTKAGYLRWREDLKHLHARKAGEILARLGYPPETIGRVQELNLKKKFPQDAEARVLEDSLCLVFLEHQLGELAEKNSDEKVINALRKSWNKMTPAGRERALALAYPPREKDLLNRALAFEGSASGPAAAASEP